MFYSANRQRHHALSTLPKPLIPLDLWKREYSNSTSAVSSMDYFWNTFYNDREWSVWKFEYKYHAELSETYKTNNLLVGFFNRLLASCEFMFACGVVFGEDNDNGIIGALLVRESYLELAVQVAPEYKSFSYTQLDSDNESDRQFIRNVWFAETEIEINDRARPILFRTVTKSSAIIDYECLTDSDCE